MDVKLRNFMNKDILNKVNKNSSVSSIALSMNNMKDIIDLKIGAQNPNKKDDVYSNYMKQSFVISKTSKFNKSSVVLNETLKHKVIDKSKNKSFIPIVTINGKSEDKILQMNGTCINQNFSLTKNKQKIEHAVVLKKDLLINELVRRKVNKPRKILNKTKTTNASPNSTIFTINQKIDDSNNKNRIFEINKIDLSKIQNNNDGTYMNEVLITSCSPNNENKYKTKYLNKKFENIKQRIFSPKNVNRTKLGLNLESIKHPHSKFTSLSIEETFYDEFVLMKEMNTKINDEKYKNYLKKNKSKNNNIKSSDYDLTHRTINSIKSHNSVSSDKNQFKNSKNLSKFYNNVNNVYIKKHIAQSLISIDSINDNNFNSEQNNKNNPKTLQFNYNINEKQQNKKVSNLYPTVTKYKFNIKFNKLKSKNNLFFNLNLPSDPNSDINIEKFTDRQTDRNNDNEFLNQNENENLILSQRKECSDKKIIFSYLKNN